MAKIVVRLQDGREGTIEDYEFNPTTMTKVGGDISTPPQSAVVAPITPQAPAEKSLLQGNLQSDKLFSGDSLLSNIINSVTKPFVKTGQTIAGAGFETKRAVSSAMGDKNAYLDKTGNVVENPFLSQGNLEKASKNPLGYIADQVKQSAAVASFGIPFGKAGFIGSKFIAPGAAVGAAQALPDAQNVEDVARGMTTGAVIGGGLQIGGKVLSKVLGGVSKVSPSLEAGAQKLEQGTRDIKLKASVYGAGQEKAINTTLTKYNVKGSPQQQYEALQPTMTKIEGKIQKVIDENPSISVTKEEIKQSFIDNLKSSLRSKDLTQSQAITEINGYLKDLIKASGGTGKFTDISLERLRNLKKLVNEDYGAVHDIVVRGGTLSPRQKVISAAWDSLDNAVKNASSEMKVLLKDESNLYKSAQSLSSARSNPPTFRFMGTSIPAEATQRGKNALTDILRAGGQKTEGLSRVASEVQSESPLINTLTGQAGVRLPQVSSNINNQPDNEQNYDNTQNNQDISPPSDIVPQEDNYVTGYSPEKLYSAYLAALSAGDKASATQLKSMYDDETKYQKEQGGSSKPLSGPNSVLLNKAQTAIKSVDRIDKVLSDDPNVLVGKLNPLSQSGRQIGADIASAIDVLGYFRTGAAITKEQRADYIYMFPNILDNEETKKKKIERLRAEFQGYAQGISNAGSSALEDMLGVPLTQ